MVYSKRQTEKLAQKLDIPVELGMTYGNPSLQSGFEAYWRKALMKSLFYRCIRNTRAQQRQRFLTESLKHLRTCL